MVLLSLSLLSLATLSLAAPSDSHSALISRAPCKHAFKTKAKETCYSLDERFKLVSGSIHKHNTFLNCVDVWVGTDICVPDGPYLANVCKSTYRSIKGDTCASLDIKFDLADGTIKGVNAYLDCKAIWEKSPICVPEGPRRTPPPATTNPNCQEIYRTVAGDTCQSIEDRFSLATGAIKAFNDYVTCNNVWANTPICVPKGLKKTDCRSVHVSKKDETCSSIQDAYALPLGSVKTANGFLDCDNIWEHTPLCIPIFITTPPAVQCPSGDFDWSTTSTPSTCFLVEKQYDLFPGAIKAHSPTIDCEKLEVGTKYCFPRGPKMAETCAGIFVTGPGALCADIAAEFSRTPEALAAANPLLPCGNSLLLPMTRVCLPAPPAPPPCAGTEVIVTSGGLTCAAIESSQGLMPYTLPTLYPALPCNSIPANTKLCIPANTPKLADCPPANRAVLQAPVTCTEIWSIFGLPTVAYLQQLNPYLPCASGAKIPAGTEICWLAY